MSDKQALDLFVRQPVSMAMISYLASTTLTVIKCDSQEPSQTSGKSSVSANANIPSLTSFITTLVQKSNVQTPTLMTSLVYLARLREKLPPMAKGMACTCHRIFLACLIMAAKNLNDSSPKNKYWAKYTMGLFPLAEVNLMEHQLLYLLDWDLRVQPSDLYTQFAPFLLPLKAKLVQQGCLDQQQQAAAAAAHRAREHETHMHAQTESATSGMSSSSPYYYYYHQQQLPAPTSTNIQPCLAQPQPQPQAQPQPQPHPQLAPPPQLAIPIPAPSPSESLYKPVKGHQYHGSYPINAPQQMRHRQSHTSLRSRLSATSLRHQQSLPTLSQLSTSPQKAQQQPLNSPTYRTYCASYKTPPVSPYKARMGTQTQSHTYSSSYSSNFSSYGTSKAAPAGTGSTLSSCSSWSAHDRLGYGSASGSAMTNTSSPASDYSSSPTYHPYQSQTHQLKAYASISDLAAAEEAAMYPCVRPTAAPATTTTTITPATSSSDLKNGKRKSRLKFWAKDNFSISKRPTLLEYVSL